MTTAAPAYIERYAARARMVANAGDEDADDDCMFLNA